jgi:hypothetical protein
MHHASETGALTESELEQLALDARVEGHCAAISADRVAPAPTSDNPPTTERKTR